MKSNLLIFFLILGFIGPCLGEAKDERLAKLEQAFLARRADAKTDLEAQLEKLDAGYLGALGRELEAAKSTGKLESVIPVQAEMEAVRAGTDPLPDMGKNATTEAKKLRVKYGDARQKILRASATVLVGLADKMEASLATHETELTKAGKIEDAVAAKAMRDSLATDPGIKDARDLLKFGLRAGLRPALVLRRQGDDIEVLVHYDTPGKISMRSPIENVRESTGKGKELGETKAKVLGEFVGASGFEAHPLATYHHVFDTKDLGGALPIDLKYKTGHEETRQKGLRLSFEPGAKNPLVNFGDVLPTTAAPGTYRITCRYLIPDSNRAVKGFQFVQGIGGPVGGQYFEKKGSWEQAQVTGISSHETGALLLYISLTEGAKLDAALEDYLVIGELRVEQIKFSAFVQRRFGESGESTSTEKDPLKQPRFVLNGELEGK